MATHSIDPMVEPRKENFTEARLPNEPVTDVKLTLENGRVLRERVSRIDHVEGVTLAFTYTELDANGNVLTTADGQPLISPTHEVALMGEQMATVDINGALIEGRKVGAARASDYFLGLERLTDIMKERLHGVDVPPAPPVLPELPAANASPSAPVRPLPADTKMPGGGQRLLPDGSTEAPEKP